MFKSFAAGWNKSSTNDKALICWLGFLTVVVVGSNAYQMMNKKD